MVERELCTFKSIDGSTVTVIGVLRGETLHVYFMSSYDSEDAMIDIDIALVISRVLNKYTSMVANEELLYMMSCELKEKLSKLFKSKERFDGFEVLDNKE